MSPGLLPSSPVDGNELLVFVGSGFDAVNLSLTDNGVTILRRRTAPLGRVVSSLKLSKASSSSAVTIPFECILSSTAKAGADGSTRISISAVKSNASQTLSKLWSLEGEVRLVSGEDQAREWVAEVERRAYAGSKPGRRLLVLVNPHGGKGKAKQVWETVAEPIFAAANCQVTLQYTGPADSPTNAKEIAKTLDIDAFDALVCVSGDGIVHEVLNGLASREDAVAALQMPLVTIPAGSGNALNVNLHGPKRALDFAWAALSAVKGTEISLDVCSVTQGKNRFFSFLSCAFGVMADIDLGTEDMRWLGDLRFAVGYVQGSLARREYPIEITLHVVESDKDGMITSYNDALSHSPHPPNDDLVADRHIPGLRFGTCADPLPEGVTVHEDVPAHLEPGWHTLKTSIFFLYAGMVPYMAKDAKMFPVARDDGLIDVAIVKPASRTDALLFMDGAEVGKHFFSTSLRYFKVECFRLTPLSPKGYIAIDGESVPHEPFQVEAHPRLARSLSLSGRLFAEPLKTRN